MKVHLKYICYVSFILLFLVSCSSNDKSLFELLPKDLDTAKHIFSYLLLSFMIIVSILIFIGFRAFPIISIIYFFVVYFTHDYGFFKLFFVSLIPTFVYVVLSLILPTSYVLFVLPIIKAIETIFKKKDD